MKNVKLLMLIPSLLMIGLTGCNGSRPYKEGIVYDGPTYIPLDLTKEGTTIKSLEVLGLYKPIKVNEFDKSDVQIRAWYNDNTSHNFEFKVVNIPIEFRHLLGEVGKHEFDIAFGGENLAFEFTIAENPNFKGFNCYFYDKDKKLVDTQVVGYYQEAVYQGKELPLVIDDDDYQYTYLGWDHSTQYISQDMQFLAVYDKLEKRLRAAKPYNWDYHICSGLVNTEKTSGKALIYLGRVYRVATVYSETKYVMDEDVSFDFSNYHDFGPFFNSVNDSIGSLINFKSDFDYNSKIYGNAAEIVSSPRFANNFDSRYDFKGMKVYLEDGVDAKLTNNDPYDYSFNIINGYLHNKKTVSKDEKDGYYRLALLNDYDVYLSASFNRLEKGIYEIGAYNEYIISPVNYSLKLAIQHSYDGKFVNNFASELTVSTRGLYNAANAIRWE